MQIARFQYQVVLQMLDATVVLGTGAAYDADDCVAFLQQKLR